MKLLASTIILEGITHIEDLPIDEFIKSVETLKDKIVTEKLDGANLWFGLDDTGLFTSREGKSRKGTRFYEIADYPLVANYNGFRAAHLAIKKEEASIKKYLRSGDIVEIEVLFGRQPNTVTYGNSEKNFIVILRGVDTEQAKVDNLAKALDNRSVKITSTVIISTDGEKLEKVEQTLDWEFTQVRPVDAKSADTTQALVKLEELKKYLALPNEKVDGRTNQEIAEISLTSVHKDLRAQVKIERERQLSIILKNFKEPIKEILLNTLVRKVKPFLQSHDLDPSEDIGVEGIVAKDPKSGEMIKIVDKDVFTAINSFNNTIRNNIAGLVRTDDQDASIELRGGAFGQAKIRIGELLGMKELALSSGTRRLLTKFKGATAAETAEKVGASISVASFGSTRTKISAILMNSLGEINEIIDEFKANASSYKLKLKTGKEIGISPEVMKRNLTAFAETKRDINEINKAVLQSTSTAGLIMALYGRTIQSLFSGSETEVKESKFNLIKTVSEDEAAPAAPVAADMGTTTAAAVAPVEKKLMGGRLVTRRARKFVKKRKFAMNKVAPLVANESLIKQIVEFDSSTNKFASDVDDSQAGKSDIEFKALRNNITVAGDKVEQSDISRYLDKAHELNDEVDTVTFGMELDDGQIVKVYVNATQADQFEVSLAELLGQEDDIEKVIDGLVNDFDIVDVEWPTGMQQDTNTPIAVEPNAQGEDGQITSQPDATGEEQVDPIIDLAAEPASSSLLKQVSDKINLDDEPTDDDDEKPDADGEPDTTVYDGPEGDESQTDDESLGTPEGDEDESQTDDESLGTPEGDEGESLGTPEGDEGESLGTPEGDEDESSESEFDLGDSESPEEDESPEDDDDDESPDEDEDESPEDEEPVDGKKKKKKKKKKESDDSLPPLNTQESDMSFGQRFKEKILAEKANAPVVKKKKEEVAVEDSHDFPPQLKKLMTEFPNRGAKMMIGLMFTLGTPLDAMVMKKSELKSSTESAGDMFTKDSQFRSWTKRLIDTIGKAQQPSKKADVAEALEKELSNVLEKLILGILRKIGMVDAIEKIARAALRKNVKSMAQLAQADNQLRTYLKLIGEILGVDGVTGLAFESSIESLEPLVEDANNEWVETVKQLAIALGIPEANINYRPSTTDMAIKKHKMTITNYAAVQHKLAQLMAYIKVRQ